MNWQEVYDRLNTLDNDFINLDNIKVVLSKEENYETENKRINTFLFYFINSLKRKIKDMPNSLDDVRKVLMSYGNDINKIISYLDGLKLNFNNLNKGIRIVKVLVAISDDNYDYKDGYENSLSYKYAVNLYDKLSEIYDRDDMSTKEKYEYIDSFEKNLSDEEKGEMHIQTLIGEQDEALLNKKFMEIMLKKVMTGENIFSKAEKFNKCLMDNMAYAENLQATANLEDNLKCYANILESPFYKSLTDVKHI